MSNDLTHTLSRLTAAHPGESPFPTAIKGLTLLRSDHPKAPAYIIFKPALCVVVQGAKWAIFGEERLEYRAGQALLVSVEMPALGCVAEASPTEPYLGIVLEFDLACMHEVLEMLDSPPKPGAHPGRGVLISNFGGALAECVGRLVRLLDTPQAIPVLYPSIMREICYWILTGPHGSEALKIALGSHHPQHLLSAIHTLRERFREAVRIDELASIAKMSPSAFHRGFKALTSMTPLQYQKQLRLIEARRLMVSEAITVETAAYDVGYESASQFSREYTRMFGASPKRESATVRWSAA